MPCINHVLGFSHKTGCEVRNIFSNERWWKNLFLTFRLHPKKGHKWANNITLAQSKGWYNHNPPLLTKEPWLYSTPLSCRISHPNSLSLQVQLWRPNFPLGQFFRPWPNWSIKKTIWVLFIRIRDIKFQGQSILSHSDILTAPENLAVVQHKVFRWQMVTFKGLRVFAA